MNTISDVRAIVFDLDGTLIDSRQDIANSVNFALRQFGLEPLQTNTITQFVGDGALSLIERATGFSPTDPRLLQVHRAFRRHYTAHPVDNTTLYPGVSDTLAHLQQFRASNGTELKLALCTNKPRATTEEVLRLLELDSMLDLVTAADDFEHKKPHPEPLLFIAERFRLLPEQLMMVGDGPQDIECAKAAGAWAVGVAYGFKPDEMLAASPDHVIDTFGELSTLLG